MKKSKMKKRIKKLERTVRNLEQQCSTQKKRIMGVDYRCEQLAYTVHRKYCEKMVKCVPELHEEESRTVETGQPLINNIEIQKAIKKYGIPHTVKNL